jgi:hypothetical protein
LTAADLSETERAIARRRLLLRWRESPERPVLMPTSGKIRPAMTLAAQAAPEDLRPGMMVAVLNEVREFPSFLWCMDSAALPPDQPVRIRWRSGQHGTPLRVMAVCLPFVCVKNPYGEYVTIDIRQTECVRLHRDYARLVWKKLRRSGREATTDPE